MGMSVLDGAALVVIFLIIILIATAIVFLGSLPGKIARKRGHPYPDAVNAASWIGLATGIFSPVAFIWAFLPVSVNRCEESADAGSTGADLDPSLTDPVTIDLLICTPCRTMGDVS